MPMFTLTPEMQAKRATFCAGMRRLAAQMEREEDVEVIGVTDRDLDALFNEAYRPELDAMQAQQERAAAAHREQQHRARLDTLLASSALGRAALADRQGDADAAASAGTGAGFSMQGAAYDRWHDQQRVQADAARKVQQQQQRQAHDKQDRQGRIEALLRSSQLGREALRMRRR